MATLLDRSGRCQDDSLDTVSSPGHEHLGLWDIYRNCPSHHPQSMAALRGAMPPKKTTALRALSKRVSGPGTSQWYRLSPERVKIGFFLFPTLCQRKGRGTQNHRVPRLAAVRRTTRRLLHAPTSFGKRSLTSLEGGTRELSCSRRTCPRDSTVSFADSGTRPCHPPAASARRNGTACLQSGSRFGFFLFPTLCWRKGRGTQNHRVPRLAAVRRTTRRLLHAPTSFGKRSLTSLEGGTRELSCSRRTCPRDSTVSFADSGTRPQNAVHKRSSSPPLRRGETGHPTSKSERHPIAQEKTLLEEQWHTCRAFRHAHNMAALWFDRALRP